MTYAVKQDMIDRFNSTELMQLTDRTGAVDTIDDTVLGRALQDADDKIDGYLVGRYTLPLASVPKALVGIACDIARYQLYEDRVTEHVQKRYDGAIRFLEQVAKGAISLGINAANAVTPEAGSVKTTETNRVFSRDTLSDY